MTEEEKKIRDSFAPDEQTAKEIFEFLVELEENVDDNEIRKQVNTIINNAIGFSSDHKTNEDE